MAGGVDRRGCRADNRRRSPLRRQKTDRSREPCAATNVAVIARRQSLDPRAVAMTQRGDQRPETNPGTLEQDIRQTRAEIGLTVAALKRKFTARHLLKEGFDMTIESFNG